MGFIGNAYTFTATGDGHNVACTNPINADNIYCKSIPQRNAIQNMQCPFPQWNNINSTTGTFYECGTNTTGDFESSLPRHYPTDNGFGIPTGWFEFTADNLITGFNKLSSIMVLIVGFITPIGFNILGYTFSDVSGLASVFIWTLYGLAYMFIGIFLYKTISPFVSVG